MKIRGCCIANNRDAMLAKYYEEFRNSLEAVILDKYKINCKIYLWGNNEVKIINNNTCEYYIDLHFQRNLANAYYGAYYSNLQSKTKEKRKDALSKMIKTIINDIAYEFYMYREKLKTLDETKTQY